MRLEQLKFLETQSQDQSKEHKILIGNKSICLDFFFVRQLNHIMAACVLQENKHFITLT
jgi:hypothetical protein